MEIKRIALITSMAMIAVFWALGQPPSAQISQPTGEIKRSRDMNAAFQRQKRRVTQEQREAAAANFKARYPKAAARIAKNRAELTRIRKARTDVLKAKTAATINSQTQSLGNTQDIRRVK